MDLEIVTAKLQAMTAEPATPKLDYTTKAPKIDKQGRQTWQVRVLVTDGSESSVYRLNVPGDPQTGVMQPVLLEGFRVTSMEIDGKTMNTYKAERLVPLGPPVGGGGDPAEASGGRNSGRGVSPAKGDA